MPRARWPMPRTPDALGSRPRHRSSKRPSPVGAVAWLAAALWLTVSRVRGLPGGTIVRGRGTAGAARAWRRVEMRAGTPQVLRWKGGTPHAGTAGASLPARNGAAGEIRCLTDASGWGRGGTAAPCQRCGTATASTGVPLGSPKAADFEDSKLLMRSGDYLYDAASHTPAPPPRAIYYLSGQRRSLTCGRRTTRRGSPSARRRRRGPR